MKKLVLLFVVMFSGMLRLNALETTNNSAFFEYLDIGNGVMSPAFDKNITEYSVKIPSNEFNLSIDYLLEDEYATLIIFGNDYLHIGLNEVILKVISSDESSNLNYRIYVTKEEDEYVIGLDENIVSLEIASTANNLKSEDDNTAQVVASICFLIILFSFGLMFGKK